METRVIYYFANQQGQRVERCWCENRIYTSGAEVSPNLEKFHKINSKDNKQDEVAMALL